LARLTKICDEKIPGNYEIEIIDVAKRPATRHQIVATPAVFRTLPVPLRKSIGDLSNKDKTILGLDLSAPRKPQRPASKNAQVAAPQAAD
jgi:circadian clock protein KaiB